METKVICLNRNIYKVISLNQLMDTKKHLEILKEVLEEIDSAQKDPQGLLSHQRRIALMLSVGICELIELYFHKLGLVKSGSRIKHDWFRQKRIKEKLEEQLITSIDSVPNLDLIIELAAAIEKSRDDLTYSSPQHDDKILLEKINQFKELQKIIERQVGEFYGTN